MSQSWLQGFILNTRRVGRIRDSYANKRRRRGMDLHIFWEFSQPLECLDEGSKNKEKVFYCSYKMILTKPVNLVWFQATTDRKKNLTLRTKFYTGTTILENLSGEINATIAK